MDTRDKTQKVLMEVRELRDRAKRVIQTQLVRIHIRPDSAPSWRAAERRESWLQAHDWTLLRIEAFAGETTVWAKVPEAVTRQDCRALRAWGGQHVCPECEKEGIHWPPLKGRWLDECPFCGDIRD